MYFVILSSSSRFCNILYLYYVIVIRDKYCSCLHYCVLEYFRRRETLKVSDVVQIYTDTRTEN